MKRVLFLCMSFLLLTGLLFGCATTKYVKEARTSFDQIKADGAETQAPFEYYAAEAYAGLAEHELAEGDYPQAKIFAEESEKYSAEAREIMGGGAR